MKFRITQLIEHIKGKFRRPHEKQRTILSLAPNDNLENDAHFSVYRDYMESAFSNPKIKNIALSGSLGAGKSSILRSFDTSFNKGKERFLYISLIDFEDRQKDGEKGETEDQELHTDQKRLEYSLLCQVLARCRKRDLQEGSLLGVPEKPKKLGIAFLCALAGSLSFVLIFHEQFAALVKMLGMVDDNWRAMIHKLLYLVADILIFVVLFFVALHSRMKKIAIKSDHAETEIDLEKEQTPLDTHRFELIYALSQIAKNIGYTVIFEDMDRIQKDVCIDILTKLRELNMMVNVRREKTNSWISKLWRRLRRHTRPVRFIYAVDDSVFDQESRTKFYDCIIPVIPALNRFNSDAILMKYLRECDVDVNSQVIIHVIQTAAPHIPNYRTVLSIRNEFVVLRDILSVNKETTMDTSYKAWIDARLLLLAIYKTIAPDECSDIFHKIDGKEFSEDLLYELFSNYLSDDQLLRRVGATDSQIRAAYLNTLAYGSTENRHRIWHELLKISGDNLVHELIDRKIFDHQNDFGISNSIANYIFDVLEDEFDWFYEFGLEMRWQKFTNCMAYLAYIGVGAKDTILLHKNAEELYQWFSRALGDITLITYDQKKLNSNWTPEMCNILLDFLWESRDKINRKSRQRTILGKKTLDELISEREASMGVAHEAADASATSG